MVPASILEDVLSHIRYIETHSEIPCSALRITDKAIRKFLPEEAQDAIVELQYLLNEYFNNQEAVEALLKYCADHDCGVTYSTGAVDTWGLTTYFLNLSKGKIWFG